MLRQLFFALSLVLLLMVAPVAHAQDPPITVDGPLIADEYFMTLMRSPFMPDLEIPSLLIKVTNGVATTIKESNDCQFWVYKPIRIVEEAWIELCDGGDTYVLFNGEEYRSIGNTNPIDFHDFYIDANNNVYTFIYNRGEDDEPFGFIIQKQSADHELLFEWASIDHMSNTEAFYPPHENGDWAHVNSLDVLYPNIMVSLRHTNSIVTIDETTGVIAWQLGGHNNDFTPKRGREMSHLLWPCMQHTARFVSQDEITVFDNGNNCRNYSRGVSFELDFEVMRVLQTEEVYPRDIMFAGAGSYEKTTNSHLFSWGFSDLREGIFASEYNSANGQSTEFLASPDYFNYQIYRRFSSTPDKHFFMPYSRR